VAVAIVFLKIGLVSRCVRGGGGEKSERRMAYSRWQEREGIGWLFLFV
jgi:hypothetical protein